MNIEDLLQQKNPQLNLVEFINSDEKYKEYKRTHPESTIEFLRELNDPKNNRWVFPFPLDIWDFWINQGISPGPHDPVNKPDNYIDPPEDNITGNYPIQPFRMIDMKPSFIYSEKYIRLWDFIYNPEHFKNNLTTGKRRFPFPRYMEDGSFSKYGTIPSLVPPFLPDAVYNNHPTIPYYLWRYSIPLEDPVDLHLLPFNSVVSQKIGFIRAHGINPKNSLDQYAFYPVNVTEIMQDTPPLPDNYQLLKAIQLASKEIVLFLQPQRPDFSKIVNSPDTTTYSPMPYAPIVFSNASAYESNGWYYFFRQKIKQSDAFPMPQDKKVFAQLMNARRYLYRKMINDPSYFIAPALFIEEAAAQSIPKVAAVYYNLLQYTPAARPSYINQTEVDASIARSDARNTLNELIELLTLSLNISPFELVFDSDKNPVYEDNPYKIITVQVKTAAPVVKIAPSITFDYKRIWTVTVPPFLSVSQPGFLDIERNNRDIDWFLRGLNSSHATLTISHNERHTALISFEEPNKYSLACTIRSFAEGIPYTTTYRFLFFCYDVVYDSIEYNPLEKRGLEYVLRSVRYAHQITDKDPTTIQKCWDETRFAHPTLGEFANRKETENVINVLEENIGFLVPNQPGFERPSKSSLSFITHASYCNSLSFIYTIRDPDPIRPFLFLRHSLMPYQTYLVVIYYTPIIINVDYFGENVKLLSYLPEDDVSCNARQYYVTWHNGYGNYAVDTHEDGSVSLLRDEIMELSVRHPLELTEYTASVYVTNSLCDNIKDDTVLYTIKYKIVMPRVPNPQNVVYNFTNIDNNGEETPPGFLYDENDNLIYSMYEEYRFDSRPYYEAMCRIYAKLYSINLKTYGRLFPHVIAFCEEMDRLASTYNVDKRIFVVDDVDPEFSHLVPSHIHPPYLFVGEALGITPITENPVIYNIFDPIVGKCVNILSLNPEKRIDYPQPSSEEQKKNLAFLLKRLPALAFYVPIDMQRFRGIGLPSLQKITLAKEEVVLSHTEDFLLTIRHFISDTQRKIREIQYQRDYVIPPLIRTLYLKTISKQDELFQLKKEELISKFNAFFKEFLLYNTNTEKNIRDIRIAVHNHQYSKNIVYSELLQYIQDQFLLRKKESLKTLDDFILSLLHIITYKSIFFIKEDLENISIFDYRVSHIFLSYHNDLKQIINSLLDLFFL